MARAIRVEYSGAVYHVTSRGNERKPIFRDDHDRRAFLSYLAEAHRRFGWIITSWVLMTNHFHLVIETPRTNLPTGMQFLNASYAAWFNARHERVGHLFGERYKAILIDKEEYLREVIRYVVLNPVRAGMVARPEDYVWSSYRATAGLEEAPAWLAVGPLIECFGELDSWRMNYVQFVADKVGIEDNLWKGLRRGIFLGGERWLKSLRKAIESKVRADDHPEIQRAAGRPSMGEILEAVGKVFGVTRRQMQQMRGGPGRQTAAWLGRYEGSHRLRKIAATLRLRSTGRTTDLIAEAERALNGSPSLQQSLRAVYTALGLAS